MSLNYTMLSGHLPQNSELRYTVSGKPVLEFMLTLQDDHPDTEPNQVHAVARKEKLTSMQFQLKKGTYVLIEGQLRNRTLEAHHKGFRKKQLEINLDTITILEHSQTSSERKI